MYKQGMKNDSVIHVRQKKYESEHCQLNVKPTDSSSGNPTGIQKLFSMSFNFQAKY